MTDQSSFEESQSTENKSNYPKFCEDCGFSLVNLGTVCLSRKCAECGKQVFLYVKVKMKEFNSSLVKNSIFLKLRCP